MSNFNELGLSDKILEVLEQIGFETPTPIQEKAIPVLLGNDHTDFIGLAQTGTGKTAAYGLPLLDLIDENASHIQGVIMAPTRELGQQIAKELVGFCINNRKINVEVVYGGASIMGQIRALKKPVQILVATPGRLIDLVNREAVQLDKVEYVVLDEADEMLNMGFKEDIDTILEHAGNQSAIWLFSATMPSTIRRIVKKYMESPLEVIVNTEEISNKDITHQYVVTKMANKLPALRRFMDMQPEMRGVLFCRTKRETEEIADELGSNGYSVAALNGDMSQDQRNKVMKLFKKRSMQLLIATDVAARGIDVKDLTHVIHHSLPDQIEYYTHRSGRTGRAGNKGISLAFVGPRDVRKIFALEKRLKVTFEQVKVPSQEQMLSSRINHWADFIVNTKINDRAERILASLKGQFEEMDKEEILKRLISTQLDHVMLQEEGSGDLNETSSQRPSSPKTREWVKKEPRSNDGPPAPRAGLRREQVGGERPERKSAGFKRENAGSGEGEIHRYFINVGTIDGVTKADLVHYLADVSGVNRSHIGGISLQKNCSYFDVNAEHGKGLSDKFKGVEIEGRPIRVNRDFGPDAPKKDKKKFWGGDGDFGGSKFKGKKKYGKGKKDF